MATTHAEIRDSGLLASLLGDEVFHPAEPQTIEQTGISSIVIETLICKYLLQVGSTSGRDIAKLTACPSEFLKTCFLVCDRGKYSSTRGRRRSTIIVTR